MKKIVTLSIFFWFCLMYQFSYYGFAFEYSTDFEGFRDVKWKTHKSQFGGLQLEVDHGGYKEYFKDNDDLEFEGLQATRIVYGFSADELHSVTIEFATSGNTPSERIAEIERTFKILADKMLLRLGQPRSSVANKDFFWSGKTSIKLQQAGVGAEVIFSDMRDFGKNQEEQSEFIARVIEQLKMLEKKYDKATTSKKIEEWLDREGADILYEYNVDPVGGNIGLDWKTGGMFLIIREEPRGKNKAPATPPQ